MIKKNSIVKGAFFLSLGAFISKLIGAIYRVPLTNLLGSYGIGLYQAVFPVYLIMLDFAGLGVPNAMASLIAGDKESNASKYLKSSLILFSVLGIIFSVLMGLSSDVLPKLQGESNTKWAYVFLSPAVFFVALISCFRGYFQGKADMTKTCLSQIIEQVIKAVLGIILVYFFKGNIPFAVGLATLAISVSELFALVYLIVSYKKTKEKEPKIKTEFFKTSKELVKSVFPVTLTGIFVPLMQTIDSFIIINILSRYMVDATSTYGIYSGVALTIINLPVSLCYGISASSIPYIAKDRTDNSLIVKPVLLTLLFSIPFAVVIVLFPSQIVGVLFNRLSEGEMFTASRLVAVMSVNVVLLSMLQTVNGILIGKGRYYTPLLGMGVGLIVKVVLTVLLLSIRSINIIGAGVGLIACYFFATMINLISVGKGRKESAVKTSLVKRIQYNK